jgi:hypothetical protein
VGDAGSTEASRPSRRVGVELATQYNVRDWLAVDADYAYSHARFRHHDPAGSRIPGAVEGVASVGLNLIDFGRLSGELRDRYFANVSDVDYFYASRLPGEPAAGIDDIHFHPVEKRALRIGIGMSL